MLADILQAVFLMHWLLLAVLYIAIRSKLKSQHPDEHSYLFGKSMLDHSVNTSRRFFSFTLQRNQWHFVEDKSLYSILNAHRLIAISFFGVGCVVFVSFFGAIIYSVFTGSI